MCFTLENNKSNKEGEYIKLSDFKGVEVQAPKTLEAINDPNCKYRYSIFQKNFSKIPSSPIAYWINGTLLESFEKCKVQDKAVVTNGLFTCDNEKYLRLWFEIAYSDFFVNCRTRTESELSNLKWYPYNKGGN